MCNGRLADFRLHLGSIGNVTEAEPATYKLPQSVEPVAKGAGRATTPAEIALEKALVERSQRTYAKALARSVTTP